MIEAIHYTNKAIESPLEAGISKAYADVRNLRPTLPESIKIHFTDKGICTESSE